MVLIMGATGNIGLPVAKNLCKKNENVKVLIRSEKSASILKSIGVQEICIGDFRNEVDLKNALQGCRSVFHVMPPFSEDEFEIGEKIISLATESGVEHFVFNSVLHSQIREMPHHFQKNRVEEVLINSGLDFNIIQPAMLMQNISSFWDKLILDKTYRAISSPKKKFALVDNEDVGEAISNILLDKTLRNAIFEFASPDILTFEEMACIIGEEMSSVLNIVSMDVGTRKQFAESQNWSPYAVDTFLKMLHHYDNYGLSGGNKLVLSTILKREPTTYRSFIKRLLTSEKKG